MDALSKIPLILLLLVAYVQGEKDGKGESDELISLHFIFRLNKPSGWNNPLSNIPRQRDAGEYDSLRMKGSVCPCMGGTRMTVGGQNAGEGSFPFAVNIAEKGGPFCGGTLITDRHVLTAAHCFEDGKPINELLVIVGVYDLRDKRDAQYFPVRNVVMYPTYVSDGAVRDIAIVELKRPVSFNDKILPVSLPKPGFRLKPGSEVLVFGWGRLETRGRYPDKLQVVKLPVVDDKLCHRKYPKKSNALCAGGEPGKDSCEGDSGSGLVKEVNGQYVQVGVVSIGPKDCGTPNYPASYTRISDFIDWILDNTKSAGCKLCIHE